jgi:hypothetical protein
VRAEEKALISLFEEGDEVNLGPLTSRAKESL